MVPSLDSEQGAEDWTSTSKLFACGYKTWKQSLQSVLGEAAGTECCLLAGAGSHFRNYKHWAELCTDHARS